MLKNGLRAFSLTLVLSGTALSQATGRCEMPVLMLGRVGDAVDQAELARDQASGPDLARAETALGFARLAGIDLDAAREAFERAIALETDPSNYSGHRFLADVYSTQPRHEIAANSPGCVYYSFQGRFIKICD